jgi:hypothetical protein
LVNESLGDRTAGCTNWHAAEMNLLQKLFDAQHHVHLALCDNLDTPKVMSRLLTLINESNIYVAERNRDRMPLNTGLLQKIASYLTRILRVRRTRKSYCGPQISDFSSILTVCSKSHRFGVSSLWQICGVVEDRAPPIGLGGGGISSSLQGGAHVSTRLTNSGVGCAFLTPRLLNLL